jgi:6,7-dimethyl-8-ribityllumazine synthase
MSTMKEIEGRLAIGDARFCIVAARFNESIVARLIDGALDALRRHGVDDAHLTLVRVPGAFEIPLAVRQVARTRRYDGVIALGTVIRGDTPHFDYVCGECASGVMRVALDEDLPIGFGVLTCDTVEQALERSGTHAGNKGAEATLSTIEMVDLARRLKG